MDEKGSIKSFGLLFSLVFLILFLWPLTNNGNPNLWFLISSLVFLVLGLLKSRLLIPLNKIWIKFGILLGTFIAPVIMALIFFLIVTPIGLMMKLFGKDVLSLKFKNDFNSYWVRRKNVKSMKKQF